MNWIRNFVINDPERQRTKISIGDDPDNPTYWRWFVWPRREPGEFPKTFWRRVRWFIRFPTCFNLYLHHWLNDDAHDPHDHRMMNISFIFDGSYFEQRFAFKPIPGESLPMMESVLRKQYSLTMRLPATPHRVVLRKDGEGRPIQSWSLFLGFPQWRNWGFWCGGKYGLTAFWRPHEEYAMSADPTGEDYGRKGRGCDE